MIKVSELFNVYSGSKLDFSKQQLDENGINFVSRNSNNNGIVGKVVLEESMKVFQKGDISVPLGGAFLLSAFVQQEDFVTAQNVAVLRPKQSMTELEKWFYCYALRLNRPKFVAFGREVNKYINDIELPDTIPDWVYKANISEIITNNKSGKFELNVNDWKEFRIGDLFNVNICKSEDLGGLEEGNIPFVGRTELNNGIQGFVESSKITKGNCISVSMVGTNVALRQDNDFVASQNIAVLRNDKNKYVSLFICALLNSDFRSKYCYGRTIKKVFLENTVIKLPVDSSGNPDREFMENYIKNLPYGDRI